tara:strand:- start:7601 stop:8257 length:657 start_codon:yes stop_codon:yes gene_type:complete
MKISYAITVCNEIEEIKRLIPILLEYKRDEDEIVVQQDADYKQTSTHTPLTPEMEVNLYCGNLGDEGKIVFECEVALNNDFAQFKNNLNSQCSGDYIFQIDADEIPNKNLIFNLPYLLDTNPDVDLLYIPRINTVKGLTQKHIQKWRWAVDSKGWVNFPDYQSRIYRNTEKLKWIKPVHEIIIGYKQFSHLPQEEEYCLYHPKQIDKQEKQNAFYETL